MTIDFWEALDQSSWIHNSVQVWHISNGKFPDKIMLKVTVLIHQCLENVNIIGHVFLAMVSAPACSLVSQLYIPNHVMRSSSPFPSFPLRGSKVTLQFIHARERAWK